MFENVERNVAVGIALIGVVGWVVAQLFIKKTRKNAVWPDSLVFPILWTIFPFIIVLYLQSTQTPSFEDKIEDVFSQPPTDYGIAYKTIAGAHYKRMHQSCLNVNQGALVVEGREECLNLYVDFLEAARGEGITVLATSTVDPTKVWNDRLRQANDKFIKAGGTIKRIFMFDEGQYEATVREAEMHRDIGVDVSLYNAGNEPGERQRDFGVNCKEDLAIEFTVSPNGDVWRGTLYTESSQVQRLKKLHASLWAPEKSLGNVISIGSHERCETKD